MKSILPLLFILFTFNSTAQQSCNQAVPLAAGDSTGGSFHVYNDSTITNGDGLLFYICSSAHLTVNSSAGNVYLMEDNSQLTINAQDGGDVVLAKGNCTIIDNTIEFTIINKESSSSFSKPNMPSGALIYTCPSMVFDYSMVGGSSPCSQINRIETIETEQLIIYPNPASSGESIFFNNDIHSLRLYSLNGKLVFEALNINTDNIELPNLTAGLYIAKMSSKKEKEIQLKINIQ
jgi:hypothetical protein